MDNTENVVVENGAKLEGCLSPPQHYMQEFTLYETGSKFYMVGRDKSRTYWRVLTIDRLDPFELNLLEDSTTFTDTECSDLLGRIHEQDKSTGGLKLITACYGIIGFIKFLGPYYMLVITERRQIGAICGHMVYAISKTEMIPLSNAMLHSTLADCRIEERYKKLLSMLDLTKDFYFSYSYHVMRTLQKNLCDHKTGQVLYETMFVWNEFLTREIRSHLQNTLWTVALVYGFFQQTTLSVAGRDIKLTLIARRSRHYAGTRYLKRGVNEKGRVANDVETEQLVIEDFPEGPTTQVSSVVQNRGSIPLFWSQETSRLNLKPDITLSKKDPNYDATRLHFQNLVERYGNPIIILNLIKSKEKKPRESILRTEFANAIEVINKDLPEENQLRFLHWDLNKHCQRKGTNVLLLLGKVAAYALTLTGFFHCQLPSTSGPGSLRWPSSESLDASSHSLKSDSGTGNGDADQAEIGIGSDINCGGSFTKKPMFQQGVLRTNCIDCLDRTNVAQYAYGLAALRHQLHALGMIEVKKIDINEPVADELMGLYEKMGDTLAHQYGGSAAHNKIFSERRGQWKAAAQSQEFLRTLQRYYNNAYVDSEKQNAINLFLGYFQPQLGKPALWELGSDQHFSAGSNGRIDDNGRFFKRHWSEGNILHDGSTQPSAPSARAIDFTKLVLPNRDDSVNSVLSESSPEISNTRSDVAYSRYTPPIPMKLLFGNLHKDPSLENGYAYKHEHEDSTDSSNFVDLDWLSSSRTSTEDDFLDRSALTIPPTTGLLSENVLNGLLGGIPPSSSAYGSSLKVREQTGTDISYDDDANKSATEEFPDSFVRWVCYGEALCH